ncbi:galactokinase [Candidatus Bipolaricaulota sp. J31]
MNPLRAAELLRKVFGAGPGPVISRAPGRVNLIGEHTDYNGGYVLPFAVDRYTEIALRPRRDSLVFVYTATFDEAFSTRLPLADPVPQGRWSDYIVGVLRELCGPNPLPHGFEAAIVSDVPPGAGLSSSASLEVAFAVGLCRLYGLEIEGLELVRLCQRAESEFVGMPCGIMDQYAVYFGEEGKALFLDTRDLKHEVVSLDLPGVSFLVVDSGVKRALAGSGYAARRRECEEAARWLARRFPERGIRSLRDVDRGMLEDVREEMPEVLWKRALHVVEENDRVLAMVKALREGDARKTGALLFSSHVSLRDLFQVSIPELDFLVEWGMAHGAFGARLVGGGFGGVTLHIVPEEAEGEYVAGLKDAYRRKFSITARAFRVHPASGPGCSRNVEEPS